ncbi:winged helix DNA-binding domain-containing protein [Prauserella muralis]|uniref:Uncharacterized protein n=1 Tax=Prauserella muralis TaxID=588067 RepID=A0A2V4B9G2_9PSEU|nr:winged helix DNA-binding domain-containing protein [Prauserella muralis]PXY31890.1 hypothetical protein BAY60_06050 [Prauserella muralis]TWE13693.1 winged helix DNA-binding protein [Prauserella muralis]
MTVLGTRALNRALLARQHLLSRTALPALDLIEHLVGMQAQAPFPPYYGLWTRLRGFQPDELSRLLLDREVVRIVLMRGTVHLVSAADAAALRPLTQPILDRDLRGNTTFTPKLAGLDLGELERETRTILSGAPHTSAELGRALARRWPDREPAALTYAARNRLPLVQVPPRAVWGRSGQTAYATVDEWLGRPVDEHPDAERMVLRYLAAFGPASVRDVQAWCGLTRLGDVVARLRPRLCVFRGADGRELFDLPGAPRPDPATPAPPRFVPEFDNLLFSHADRTRVISDADRKGISTRNAVAPAVLLVNGFVRATWRIERGKESAVLDVRPLRALSKKDTAAVRAEGRRLLRFAGVEDGEVRVGSAGA